ncbi:hypothetical protein OESDEN_25504 [Oesophagostomum dentatum]|uniref:Uncharacterized protein n=1 Tax=Oesophagostomum dentatum TaxID=61180 RepID=A0A0B1RUZ8_OESDE|nr:hypothetical protein OESDEN_25504 [Oesophagostomum dentatum]
MAQIKSLYPLWLVVIFVVLIAMDFILCMGQTYLLDLSGRSMFFMKSCSLLLNLLVKRPWN